MVVGFGSHTGDGPGFPLSRGDGLHITMDAGSCMKIRGCGGPVSLTGIAATIVQSGRQLMFRSSDSTVGSVSGSRMVAGSDRLVGFPSGRVMATTRGGADIGRV